MVLERLAAHAGRAHTACVVGTPAAPSAASSCHLGELLAPWPLVICRGEAHPHACPSSRSRLRSELSRRVPPPGRCWASRDGVEPPRSVGARARSIPPRPPRDPACASARDGRRRRAARVPPSAPHSRHPPVRSARPLRRSRRSPRGRARSDVLVAVFPAQDAGSIMCAPRGSTRCSGHGVRRSMVRSAGCGAVSAPAARGRRPPLEPDRGQTRRAPPCAHHSGPPPVDDQGLGRRRLHSEESLTRVLTGPRVHQHLLRESRPRVDLVRSAVPRAARHERPGHPLVLHPQRVTTRVLLRIPSSVVRTSQPSVAISRGIRVATAQVHLAGPCSWKARSGSRHPGCAGSFADDPHLSPRSYPRLRVSV